MGAENSKGSSGPLRLSNISKEQTEKVSWKLHSINKNKPYIDAAQFKSTYPALSAVSDRAVSRLQGKDGKIAVDAILKAADGLLGDASEQADALAQLFGDVDSCLRSVVDLAASQLPLSPADAASLLAYLQSDAPADSSRLCNWIASHPLVPSLVRTLFSPLAFQTAPSLLPTLSGSSDLLSSSALAVINAHLPMDRRKQWTQLFSSSRQGASFSQLLKRIDGEGPCLLLVKSDTGRVFGGFASDGFAMGPQYRGDATCFLFQSAPDMHVYSATGFCKQYAYLNHGQASLPNGVGIGGYEQVWPFFICDDFNTGIAHSNISSFDKCSLAAKSGEFHITAIEAYRCGDKPRPPDFDPDDDTPKRDKSIIDKDPEAKALLELSGRKMHSEAYREPEPMLDEE